MVVSDFSFQGYSSHFHDPVPRAGADYSLMWRRPTSAGSIPPNTSYMLTETIPPVKVKVKTPKKVLTRREKLEYVFDEMDLDRTGFIHKHELNDLAMTRRRLGQVEGVWTVKKNNHLFQKIDKDGDGEISKLEFVDYYDELLPDEEAAFAHIAEQFIVVAETIGNRKRKARDTGEEEYVVQTPATVKNSLVRGVFSPWLAPEQPYQKEVSNVTKELDYLDRKYACLELNHEMVSPKKPYSESAHGPADSALWAWEHKPEPLPEHPAFKFEAPDEEEAASPAPVELTRREKLALVFEEMDLDLTRKIHREELHELASTRRALGQVEGKWSKKKNDWLFGKIDKDGDGEIDEEDFVNYYDKHLPFGPEFDRICEDFKVVGKHIRERKQMLLRRNGIID